VYLEELLALPLPNGGTDFERAHHEAFLYQLLGARDAFMMELDRYYGAGLRTDVTLGKLRSRLKQRGIISREVAELYRLEIDQNSWLNHAKTMRDHATHRGSVPRTYYLGGPRSGKVHLKNPETGMEVDLDILSAFKEWLTSMRFLIDELRRSAIAANT